MAPQPGFTEADREEWGRAVEQWRAGDISEEEYRAAQTTALNAAHSKIAAEYMEQQHQRPQIARRVRRRSR